jgi:hypothetical protein
MKIGLTPLSSRLDSRLAAYAAVATAALAAPALPTTDAAVITSGPLNLAVPQNLDGIYLNLVTGATGTSTPPTGWDFNPYATSSGTLLSFNFATGAGGVAVGGVLQNLAPGTTISAASTFLTGLQTTATANSIFRAGVNAGYLGLRFVNEATGLTNYGYVQFTTTGPNGFGATILSYAYENTGAAITVVPEPSTFALFGVMAVGALGVRAWRKRKAA